MADNTFAINLITEIGRAFGAGEITHSEYLIGMQAAVSMADMVVGGSDSEFDAYRKAAELELRAAMRDACEPTKLARFAQWMDRPGMLGWVCYGPNGRAMAWAPTERLIRWVQKRLDPAHDHNRCGTGWIRE